MISVFAHAFGQRYELPIPLILFLLGGAGVVFLSFLLVIRKKVPKLDEYKQEDHLHLRGFSWPGATLSFIFLGLISAAGIFGAQEVAENILPTLFWIFIWVGLPLSCGIIGDWTETVNPFSNIAKLTDSKRLRQSLLGQTQPLNWPKWLGWWPAAAIFFIIICGELIFNQFAIRPEVIGWATIVYFGLSAFLGLLFGRYWIQRGEVFSVLFATWGRLGYFRFGSPGKSSFAGGLVVPFEASFSRVIFVLLLLASVSFDGLLSTPLWNNFQHNLPSRFSLASLDYELLACALFASLTAIIWLVFSSFARAVTRAGGYHMKTTAALAGLLPSLLPISFGYLLAHYMNYLLVNGQLMFPLLGNPIGRESWPLHLAYPFNDEYEVHTHLLPSGFYWYFAVAVIVIAHVIAVFLAHQHLGSMTKDEFRARRSEYPWVVAMVLYTMLSLWLLAQPLVKEKPTTEGLNSAKPPVYLKSDG